MSASATEMLFAMGAGPQVEAVDMTSNYPEDVPTTDLSAFTPNAEAIAGYQPDLVVLSDDLNGIVAALDALSIPTLLLGAPDTLEESYEQFETLGAATGHADDAAKAVQDVQDRIDAAIESAADAEGMTVYHELDPTYYSASSSTFIGSIYGLFGLENIADEAPGAETGYPQLSAEYVVGAAPGPDRAGRHHLLRPERRRRGTAPGLRHRARRAGGPGSRGATTTSPPAGVPASPTSPSRSPRPSTADDPAWR